MCRLSSGPSKKGELNAQSSENAKKRRLVAAIANE
jgi:hypothetical protein